MQRLYRRVSAISPSHQTRKDTKFQQFNLSILGLKIEIMDQENKVCTSEIVVDCKSVIFIFLCVGITTLHEVLSDHVLA